MYLFFGVDKIGGFEKFKKGTVYDGIVFYLKEL